MRCYSSRAARSESSAMPVLQQNHRFQPSALPAQSLSPPETARYTSELLESLRKIAARQGQELLAHLLELAKMEANSLCRPKSRRDPS